MVSRISAAFYGHIPRDVRSDIRHVVGHGEVSADQIRFIAAKYGVHWRIIMRVLASNPDGLRRSYEDWLRNGD